LTPAVVSALGSSVKSISAGASYACAVTSAGAALCWGSNAQGQLGNNSTVDSSVPVAVVGLSSGVASIVAGVYTTCAVTTGGAVTCWGDNSRYNYGDGTTHSSLTPVAVPALSSGIEAVSLGFMHGCALTTSGGLKCWGNGVSGQLGVAGLLQSTTPVDVPGLTTGVVAVTAGHFHSCALTSLGRPKCWGDNSDNQIGNNNGGADTKTPDDVADQLGNVASISAGSNHTCVVTTSGAARCWGANFGGQLGDGQKGNGTVPVNVAGLSSGVAQVDAGHGNTTCARLTAGGLRCWGTGGLLGDGATTDAKSPVSVVGFP
jgi:alpha-tubulin suppressor-like RCC1 family protein